MLQRTDNPIARLRYLADAVEHGFNGLDFNMNWWSDEGGCGTAGCIAGHACAIWAPDKWQLWLAHQRGDYTHLPYKDFCPGYVAADLLGLSDPDPDGFDGHIFWQTRLTRETAAAELRRLADVKEAAEVAR